MTGDEVLHVLAELVAQRLRDQPAPTQASGAGWISVAEVARRLGRHPDTITKDLRAGRIPGTKVGRAWRVKAADLELAMRPVGQDQAEDERRRADARAWAREQRRQARGA